MKLIALDPSGNWGKEGMGTTGIAIMIDGVVQELTDIKEKIILLRLSIGWLT
jgi:hypothetical protein